MAIKVLVSSKLALICCILAALVLAVCDGFPQGAPPEACETLSPQRGHGVPSQAVEYAPFAVVMQTNTYNPGDRINVEIVQRDPNVYFKGFLVQALDAKTHQVVGEFLLGQGMQSLRECSAVTHTDNRPKRSANLVWQAPYDRAGQILVRATIVVSKEHYYANILAQVAPQPANSYQHLGK